MFYSLLTPHRFLLLGFIIIVVIGSFLLTLPIASTSGNSQSFIDALFVATSAVSTTGLTVVDLGSFYSLFGQIVILVLIQIGGLGYMIFVVTIVLQLGGKLSLGGKLILEESLSSPPYEEVSRFSKVIIFITFLFEFLGAAVLSLYWMREFPAKHAIYLGIFHSVSAFGTVGLSTGVTPALSVTGKIVLVITMLIGRVGPLAIGFSIRGKCKLVPIKYPEGGILVG
jgi:trk system potassium uptake protein TrkH